MSIDKTRSKLSMRALVLAQALILLASLAVPMAAMAAITGVSPGSMNQGASGSITIAGTPGNNFPNSGTPFAVTFSGTGVTATNVVRHSSTQITADVTVTPGATPGARTLTVSGAGGFVSQTATFTVNAAKVNSTTSITSDTPDPSSVGAVVSVGVSVVAASGPASPTGSVTVSDGNVTSAPCALSGSGGTVTATCSLIPATAGAKTLTATYGGDAAFNGSSGTAGHTVLASQAPLILTGTSSPAAYHDTQALGTTGGSGTGAVTYSTGASTACSVVGTTLTISASTGTCLVTATKAADADYLATTSATADITVGKAVLVVTPDPQAVSFGDPVPVHTFAVTGFRNGEDAGTAAGYTAPTCTSAYTPSTPVASSPLLITCSGGAATNYTFNTSATAQLTIGASAQASLVLTGTSSPAAYGTSQALGTTGGSGTGAVSYTSTTPAVCTISAGNSLTIVSGTGTCSVYATKAADADFGAATSATVDITAAKAAPTCAITGVSVVYDGAPHGATGACTGVAGETLTGLDLGASFTDVPGGTAAWMFTDVTGNYLDDSGSADVTISRAGTTTVVTCGPGPFTYTGSAQTPCSASVTGPGGLDDTLTVAYLNNTDAGTATGEASYPGDGNYNPSADSTTFEIARADAACTIEGYTGPFDGLAHGASGSCTGVNDETLSGLDRGASFVNVPGGTVDWTFSNGNYRAGSGSVDIEITQVEQAIAFPDIPNVTLGAPGVELEATTGSGLPITYRSLPPAVCRVSGATLTAVGVGTCRVEASQAGDANHEPAVPVTRSFVVAAADSSTPETSTASPIDLMRGSGPLPPALLLGLLGVGMLAIVLMLLGFQAGRDGRRPTDSGW